MSASMLLVGTLVVASLTGLGPVKSDVKSLPVADRTAQTQATSEVPTLDMGWPEGDCPPMMGPKDGRRRGPGSDFGHGPRRPGHGDPLGRLFDQLDKLAATTPPSGFPLELCPQADTDGDGALSEAEWTAFAQQARQDMLNHLLKRIPSVDTDGDGAISEAELAALKADWLEKVRERLLTRHPEADTDGDGQISDVELEAAKTEREAQHRAMMLKQFPDADTDGDGTLSEDEAHALRIELAKQHAAEILERHPEADTNGDGVLSHAEMQALQETQMAERQAKLLERHPEADLNSDGVLSMEEMEAFHQGHQGFGPGRRGGPREHPHDPMMP